MSPTQEIADQFIDLIAGLTHLRSKYVSPEHKTPFRQQLENLKNLDVVSFEERPILFRLYILMSRSKTPPTMGEISSELGVPLSSTTRVVDGLVNVNLLERINDPLDRRVVRIQMSELGKQFSQSAYDHIRNRITKLLSILSPTEQEQLLQLVTKLFNSIKAERQK